MEGMVYAAVAYSTIARGTITHLATDEAEAAPGVVSVMTHENAPRLKPPPVFMSASKAAGGDNLPIMQDARVRWNGEPIAVVLAETRNRRNMPPRWSPPLMMKKRRLSRLPKPSPRVRREVSSWGSRSHNEKGDAEKALASAATSIDSTYTTPRHNHNAIELHGVTVAWDGETLRVHDASQLVAHTAWSLAQMFGISEEQVVVTSPFVGGGFGGKCLWQHQVLAAAAAKLVGRPVRLVLSREGVYRVVGGRSLTEQRVALGADRDGRLRALIHAGTTAKTSGNVMPEPFILPTRSAYAAENYLLDVQSVELDMLANTFMRAPGESVGTFALECAIDELAEKLGVDPIELRILNEPETDPTSGLPFSARHIDVAWRQGAEKFGWQHRDSVPRNQQDGEWLVGLGCATATYPYYRMPGGAARITLTKNAEATVDIAAHEMGMGTATVQTQVIAERLGLPLTAVTFNYGDSTLPGVVLAGGSRQTAAIGASVITAHRALVAELIKLAGNDSPLAGLKPDEIASRDGGLCKRDDDERFESYASILARAQRDEVSIEATPPMPLEMMHWSMHSHGAMFCEVRVNSITGEIRVSRFLASFDCGRILECEDRGEPIPRWHHHGPRPGADGRDPVRRAQGTGHESSLAEYHVPVHMDVPEIEVMWTDIPDPHTPMGARGVGEIGITGTAAAVANAVYNATGKRVRDLPITLDKLL